jgi:hypothetical protein
MVAAELREVREGLQSVEIKGEKIAGAFLVVAATPAHKRSGKKIVYDFATSLIRAEDDDLEKKIADALLGGRALVGFATYETRALPGGRTELFTGSRVLEGVPGCHQILQQACEYIKSRWRVQ